MTLFYSFTKFVIACCFTVRDHYSDIVCSFALVVGWLWYVKLLAGALYCYYSGGLL